MANEARAMGFWTEVSGIKFDDTSMQSWIQALPLGSYEHPVYGEINNTPEKVDRMIQNFRDNVRQTELDIDFDHKEDLSKGSRAAGWVKDMANRGADGLWILVEWTKEALTELKSGAWKYFSPEFVDAWTHPKTGQTFEDVLFGGGITNRPFLKDIQPINMSEVFGRKTSQGGHVEEFLKKLREMLGLSEEADETLVLSELATKLANPPKPTTEPPAPTVDEAALAKLMETNPAVRQLKESNDRMLAEREADRLRLSALEAVQRFRDVTDAVKTACTSEAYMVAPAYQLQLVEVLKGQPKQLSDGVIKALAEIVQKGIVELGERGRRRGGRETTDASNPTATFLAEVAKVQEANKGMSFSDASVVVAGEKPELYDAYAEDATAGDIVTSGGVD